MSLEGLIAGIFVIIGILMIIGAILGYMFLGLLLPFTVFLVIGGIFVVIISLYLAFIVL